MSGRDPRIVIIGAGVAGIATAVTLQRAGFRNFTMLEKGADVGGVWHWNRYPGLTCDVPSQLYQFSFAPKPDWSGLFAPGSEIQRYLRDVVERFGLGDHLRLNAEVVSAVFTGSGWQIKTSDGAELDADFVIAATGVLHHTRHSGPRLVRGRCCPHGALGRRHRDRGQANRCHRNRIHRRAGRLGASAGGRVHQSFRSQSAVGDMGTDVAPPAWTCRCGLAQMACGPPGHV
jgi:2-polyprenyl-6-methoxyphenol hydroxylase-like FAD-dependent oxidoreductase